MRIVLNHLTRMKTQSRICIAGVNPETLAHVRPVTPPDDLITRDLLRENGGPFAIGALVDLGEAVPRPNPPEIEDHGFRTEDARLVELLAPDEYWRMLEKARVDGLEEAFGPELTPHGRGLAIESGHGTQSLAVVRLADDTRLKIDPWGKLRLHIDYQGATVSPSVTDVRFCEPDHETIRTDVVVDVNARLGAGVDAYMMLGLSRSFSATDNLHWAQLNGLCLADDPVGETP